MNTEFIIERGSRIMSRRSIPLLCYWDGRISHGPQGITYEGSNPKAIKVNRGVKHSELIEMIYELIGIDSKQYELKIMCRYLANGQYVALPIGNDVSVDIMLDMTKEKGINCIELYIEKSYVFVESQSGVRFTKNDGGNKDEKPRDPSYVYFNIQDQTGKLISCRMKPDTPFRKLIAAFCERQGYNKYTLMYDGHRLEAWGTPKEYHLRDGDVMDAVSVMRGD